MIGLDELIHNPDPGYQSLVTQILMNLDPQSLLNCRLLSKVFKNFIDNTKVLIGQHIKQAFTRRELNLQNKDAEWYEPEKEKYYEDLILKSKNHNKAFYNKCMTRLDFCDLKIVFEFMNNVWANPTCFKKIDRSQQMCILKFVYKSHCQFGPKNYLKWARPKNYSKNVPYEPDNFLHSNLCGRFQAVLYNLVRSEKMLSNTLRYISRTAIFTKKVELVQEIINDSISTGNKIDLEPIHLYEACASRNPDILKAVMDYPFSTKFSLNTVLNGATPFAMACKNGPLEVLDLCLEYIQKYEENFDFNKPLYSLRGRTAMYWASDKRDGTLANRMINLHKEKKITLNFNHQDNSGDVFWTKFATYGGCTKHFESLKIVLDLSRNEDENINLAITNNWGWTVLHHACRGGKDNHRVVKLLLEHNLMTQTLNPHAQDDEGNTPLHLACKEGHYKMVEVFLDHQLGNYLQNERGRTPWQEASENGHRELIQWFSIDFAAKRKKPNVNS